MNKTIIININGIVFHIEEDAYDALRSYMIDVKKHFAYTEDSKEIVGDIENRIAEMFNERIVPGKKEVITMQDVEEVCAQMGKVSDFESESTGEAYDYSQSTYYGSSYSGARKLYRDPDDKVFGGVCSGLGHYLDIETLWVRLAMVLLFVFAGTGFLLYIILWIVVPIAKTRADRMAMRGEAPNLQNFKRNFEEEMEGLRGNFTMAGERIKPGLNKAADSLEGAANFIAKAFVVLLKVIGALVIFGLSAGIIGLLICLVLAIPDWTGDGFGGFYDPDFPIYLVPEAYKNTIIVAAFFSLAIPLLALIILAIRIVFNRRIAGSYVGFGLLILWLVSAGTLSYYTIQTTQDFREDASIVQERMLAPFPAYYLDVNDVNVIKKVDTNGNSLDSLGTIIKSNRKRGNLRNMNAVDISIIKGEGKGPAKLVQEFHASGKNFDLAAKRAERIIYNVQQQAQHVVFDNNSTLPKGELMRDQRVSIKMLLPVGAKLFVSNDADRHIRNLPVWQCREHFSEENRASYTEWIMTEEGLKCIAEMAEEEHALPADSIRTGN
ncbi:PspC domain-containing protein [Olivibacter sp. XZL3]|uniref:PspC domain-containing protein n=1 Tax=Olivibacter sp. XZL3 TaxID=1735116 RepID=UPI001064AB7C|nr:PspC domain-containing protein [Olivibacter sp. XZL3]